MLQRFLPLGYVWLVVQGLLSVFLPRQAIKLNARLLLSGYENPGDLEPKAWYVRSTRITGLGMLVTGLTGLLAGELVEADDEADSDDPLANDSDADIEIESED